MENAWRPADDSGRHATITGSQRDRGWTGAAVRAVLITGRGSRGRGRSGRFGGAQIALGLVLGEIENDNFVGSASAFHVELDGLANGLVFFLDALIVRDDGHRVAVVLGVNFLQLHLNRADVLGGVGFGEIEFENVAFAASLEFLDFVVVARDQAALNTQVSDGALKFALGGFEVGLGGIRFALGTAQLGSDFADFRGSVGLNTLDLSAKVRIALLLIFLDRLGQTTRLGEFVLG